MGKKSIPALEFPLLMILRKLLRKSKHYVSTCSSRCITVQTVSINPKCKRRFSKVYCSPNDNIAILTDFPESSGSLEKPVKQPRSFTGKKNVGELDSLVEVCSIFPFWQQFCRSWSLQVSNDTMLSFSELCCPICPPCSPPRAVFLKHKSNVVAQKLTAASVVFFWTRSWGSSSFHRCP